MSATFEYKELFGGAIIVDLPRGWIDASDIRQIPDHQEVFLSSTSDVSIVIEINQRVEAATCGSGYDSDDDSSSDAGKRRDKAALLYHLKDLVETPPERSIPQSITETNETTIHLQPTPVSIARLVDTTPAYMVSAASASMLTDNFDPSRSTQKHTMIFLLMVRLKSQGTDLLAILNIPLNAGGSDAANGQEGETWASEVMGKIAASLEIKDWGLFGEE